MTVRVLLLTHRIAFPPNKGDKIRSYNILKHLARSHEVYAASLIDDPEDLQHVPRIESLARQFVYQRIHRRLSAALAARALLTGRPITVTHFYSRSLQQRIDRLITAQQIEVLLCYSSPMAEYVFRSRSEQARRALKVMDLVDVDSYKWRQYVARSAPPRAWIYRYEARRIAAYERRIASAFDRMYVVTEQERNCFPQSPLPATLEVMSNGVDLQYFAPQEGLSAPAADPTIVFTGLMNYWPNIDGATWFAQRVFPRVRLAFPAARFLIVGNRPSADVRRLGELPGVEVTGFVSDVRQYVAAANVCIAPLRVARGIQNKVLEAMAMGKAVVGTPQALEGLEATVGAELLMAETEEAFAQAINRLLADPGEASRLGRAARCCVERHYSWDDNLSVLDDLMLSLRGSAAESAAGSARGPASVVMVASDGR